MRIATLGSGAMARTLGSRWAACGDELLNVELFNDLREAKVLIERWRKHYNTIRPHTSLGYQPPAPETIVPADLASTVWRLRPHQPSIGSSSMVT